MGCFGPEAAGGTACSTYLCGWVRVWKGAGGRAHRAVAGAAEEQEEAGKGDEGEEQVAEQRHVVALLVALRHCAVGRQTTEDMKRLSSTWASSRRGPSS
jgi:hypothetical protein